MTDLRNRLALSREAASLNDSRSKERSRACVVACADLPPAFACADLTSASVTGLMRTRPCPRRRGRKSWVGRSESSATLVGLYDIGPRQVNERVVTAMIHQSCCIKEMFEQVCEKCGRGKSTANMAEVLIVFRL